MRLKHWFYTVPLRLRSLILRRQVEQELDEELRYHLERQIEEHISKGMTEEEARHAALRAMGGVERRKEECRDMRRVGWIEDLIQDARYSLRILRKNPGFTIVVALSLALGIGANTTVFSLIDAVLLKTLPVKEPERLVLFRWLAGKKTIERISVSADERDNATGLEIGTEFSYPVFEHFRANNRSLSETFAFAGAGMKVNVDGQKERSVLGHLVSGNYFVGLGLPTLLGRTLTDDDCRESAEPVVVVSYKYWQRRFSGDPAVVGKTVYISETAFTIVGVTPREFYGTSIGSVPEIWVPLPMMPKVRPDRDNPLSDPKIWWLNIMGRLMPGVSSLQAQAEFNLAMRQHFTELQKSFNDQRDFPRIDLDSGSQGLMQARRKFSEPLRILMIIVGLVLAIACLNIANLLLSRSAARRKEIAVRLAAGASRLRLIRQLLTESLLLAALGGGLGLAFAYWGKGVLVALRPLGRQATLPDLNLDPRVLGFTAAVTILAGILFGLAPALRATKVDIFSALKEGAGQTGPSRSRLGKGLIVAQMAISLVLLVDAGLFVRTLHNLMRGVGFNHENLLLFNISPGDLGYQGERLATLYQQLLERIDATPGVRSATATQFLMLDSGLTARNFCVPGYTPQPGEEMMIPYLLVATNFFETMEMPILRGRGLTRQDIESLVSAITTSQSPGGRSPKDFVEPRQVAVINQAMARKYFPGVDPIGRSFTLSINCNSSRTEIVGVVRDARYEGLRQETPPITYLPYVEPSSGASSGMRFIVRTASDPAAMTASIQEAVLEVEPRLTLDYITMHHEQIAQRAAQERLFAILSSFFGLSALILVAIGLYGVMSYMVARRTHEIGVRMALGAERGDLLRLVMRETLWLALAGVALGIPAALIATRWIGSQLFEVEPYDPLTITLVTLLLVAVMTLAGYLPARKAAQVDPLQALRRE